MPDNVDHPNPRGSQTQFYTVAELKELFRVSKMTIYRSIRDGEIKALSFRRRLLVAHEEVERIKENGLLGKGVTDPKLVFDDDQEDRKPPGGT